MLMSKILMVLAGLTLSSGIPMAGNEDMIKEDSGGCELSISLMKIMYDDCTFLLCIIH